MTLEHQKYKVMDFVKTNFGPDSSQLSSQRTDTKFTPQISKLLVLESILSNQKLSPKCHRQLNTRFMNAMHAIVTLRA